MTARYSANVFSFEDVIAKVDLRVKGTLTRIQAKLNLENLRKVIGLTCIVIRNGRAIENDTFYGASLA